MSEPRILQVLAKFEGSAVADISGEANPVVVLDDNKMSTLLLLLREVREELRPVRSAPPGIGRLLDFLSEVVDQYRSTRNKYYGGVSGPVNLSNRIRELDEMLAELQKFPRPKK